MADPVEQYLQRHVEPEVRALPELPKLDAAIVVPVRREPPELLEGLEAVARGRDVLVVLVVNATTGGPGRDAVANAELMRALIGRDRADEPTLAERDGFTLLLVDRSSPGRELPAGQGVGLARKIGCDIVLQAWAQGRIVSPFIRTTDADASLHPEDLQQRPDDAVAIVHPFWHEPSGEPRLDHATALYELWLRYYAAGLAWAGSPWAMTTIGSTLAVHARAYATVRGMPRRTGGEDFHLLAKLAKLGPIAQPQDTVVRLKTRQSDRVPFGTGPGVAKILGRLERGEPVTSYDPACFAATRRVLEVGQAMAEDPSRHITPASFGPEPWWPRVLDRLGSLERLSTTLRNLPSPAVRRRRVLEWLDALATLRLVHAVRDEVHPELPWVEALRGAVFFESELDVGDPLLVQARRNLAHKLPLRAGLGNAGALDSGRTRP